MRLTIKNSSASVTIGFLCLVLIWCIGCSGGGSDGDALFPPLSIQEKDHADERYARHPDYFTGTDSVGWMEAPYTIVSKLVVERSSIYRFNFFLAHNNRGYDACVLVLYDEDSNIVQAIQADPEETASVTVGGPSNSINYDIPENTSFFDVTLLSDRAYYLKIAAKKKDRVDVISVCAPEFTDYSVPGDVPSISASDGTYNDRIRVTWNGAMDATGYLVYRADSASGPYSEIAHVGIRYYYDDFSAEDGSVYYYRVDAYNDAGQSSTDEIDSGYISGLQIIGELEFHLTWSYESANVDDGPDLDIHVIDPQTTEWFYSNAENHNNPNLDHDDLGESGSSPLDDGGGPERMYWSTPESGTYTYFVQWFQNESASTYAHYTLKVYKNGNLAATQSGVFSGDPADNTESKRYQFQY